MNDVTKYERHALPMSAEQIRDHVNAIQRVMEAVMKKDVHYGVVPGTDKPALFKPGAETLCKTFHIAPSFKVEDLSTAEYFRYRVTCIGTHQESGIVLGEGMGAASSMEEKYKWRRAVCDEEFELTEESRRRVKFGKKRDGGTYRVKQVRAEAADIDNTVLKMACKRASVAMVLNVTAASDIFAQDIEDLPDHLREVDDEAPDVRPTESVRSKSGKVEKTETQQQGEAKPAPESMKKMLRARLASAQVEEPVLFEHFKHTGKPEDFWAGLTLDRGNQALQWIANPS